MIPLQIGSLLAMTGSQTSANLYVWPINPTTGVATDSGVAVMAGQYHAAFGKPVCTSTVCSIPYIKSADRTQPQVYFANGTVVGNSWAAGTDYAGGYLAYNSVDHGYNPDDGRFTVAWQSLSGKSLVHRRDTVTSAINTAAELNVSTVGPLVAVGTSRTKQGGPTFLHHTFPLDAYVPAGSDEYEDDGMDMWTPADFDITEAGGLVTVTSGTIHSPISVSVQQYSTLDLDAYSPVSISATYIAPDVWQATFPSVGAPAGYRIQVDYLDTLLTGRPVQQDHSIFFNANGGVIAWSDWACLSNVNNCIYDGLGNATDIVMGRDFKSF